MIDNYFYSAEELYGSDNLQNGLTAEIGSQSPFGLIVNKYFMTKMENRKEVEYMAKNVPKLEEDPLVIKFVNESDSFLQALHIITVNVEIQLSMPALYKYIQYIRKHNLPLIILIICVYVTNNSDITIYNGDGDRAFISTYILACLRLIHNHIYILPTCLWWFKSKDTITLKPTHINYFDTNNRECEKLGSYLFAALKRVYQNETITYQLIYSLHHACYHKKADVSTKKEEKTRAAIANTVRKWLNIIRASLWVYAKVTFKTKDLSRTRNFINIAHQLYEYTYKLERTKVKKPSRAQVYKARLLRIKGGKKGPKDINHIKISSNVYYGSAILLIYRNNLPFYTDISHETLIADGINGTKVDINRNIKWYYIIKYKLIFEFFKQVNEFAIPPIYFDKSEATLAMWKQIKFYTGLYKQNVEELRVLLEKVILCVSENKILHRSQMLEQKNTDSFSDRYKKITSKATSNFAAKYRVFFVLDGMRYTPPQNVPRAQSLFHKTMKEGLPFIITDKTDKWDPSKSLNDKPFFILGKSILVELIGKGLQHAQYYLLTNTPIRLSARKYLKPSKNINPHYNICLFWADVLFNANKAQKNKHPIFATISALINCMAKHMAIVKSAADVINYLFTPDAATKLTLLHTMMRSYKLLDYNDSLIASLRPQELKYDQNIITDILTKKIIVGADIVSSFTERHFKSLKRVVHNITHPENKITSYFAGSPVNHKDFLSRKYKIRPGTWVIIDNAMTMKPNTLSLICIQDYTKMICHGIDFYIEYASEIAAKNPGVPLPMIWFNTAAKFAVPLPNPPIGGPLSDNICYSDITKIMMSARGPMGIEPDTTAYCHFHTAKIVRVDLEAASGGVLMHAFVFIGAQAVGSADKPIIDLLAEYFTINVEGLNFITFLYDNLILPPIQFNDNLVGKLVPFETPTAGMLPGMP